MWKLEEIGKCREKIKIKRIKEEKKKRKQYLLENNSDKEKNYR